MTDSPAATASLAIVESLCLELEAKGMLSRREVSGVLSDVAEAFAAMAAEAEEGERATHLREAEEIARRMRDGEGAPVLRVDVRRRAGAPPAPRG